MLRCNTKSCAVDGVCRLQGVLDEAVDAFYPALGQGTLEDLVRGRPTLARVLMLAWREAKAAALAEDTPGNP